MVNKNGEVHVKSKIGERRRQARKLHLMHHRRKLQELHPINQTSKHAAQITLAFQKGTSHQINTHNGAHTPRRNTLHSDRPLRLLQLLLHAQCIPSTLRRRFPNPIHNTRTKPKRNASPENRQTTRRSRSSQTYNGNILRSHCTHWPSGRG